MAKLALYQKYRSSTFEEVVGQEYVVRSIKNAVRENKVGHAYLFCGPRGTGKTTMARILAKAVNCEHPEIAPCEECDNCKAANAGTHPDIVEINAANETHVEDIRDLIDRSQLAPMMGKHKVYIIDEVHQLSSAASSALLKTLEEPPENVIFILATTDPQKLLPTIISRCQRFDFTKVRTDQIRDHLLDIAKKENIEMEEQAARQIAELADGGMRDALSMMDQCASFTDDHITAEAIDTIYGLATTEEKIGLLKDIFQCNLEGILNRTEAYEKKGIDLQRFTDGMIDILKDTVIYQNTNKPELLQMLNEEQAKDLSNIVSSQKCMQYANELLDAKTRFRTATDAGTVFEVACLTLATEKNEVQPISRETAPAEKPSVKPVIQPAEKNTGFVSEPASVRSVPDPGPAPVKKEPEKTEPEEKPVVPIEKEKEIDQDMILSILVQCDKNSKVTDENTMAMVKSYANLKNRKYTSLLEETKLAASGKDCILLTTRQQAVANRINAEQMNRELYFFMRDTMHTDKMLYAITEDAFRNATNAFRTSMKAGTLPEPLKIERYQEETEKEEKPEDKVKKLFGADNVEII